MQHLSLHGWEMGNSDRWYYRVELRDSFLFSGKRYPTFTVVATGLSVASKRMP